MPCGSTFLTISFSTATASALISSRVAGTVRSMDGTTTIILHWSLLQSLDDLIELCHNGVLFLLGLLHVEEDQSVVGQHLQMVLRVSEPCGQIVDGVLACCNLAVEALGLDINVVNAVPSRTGRGLRVRSGFRRNGCSLR